MSDFSNTIANGLSQAYQDYARRVHTLAAQLSEEQFWRKPYAYGNSFGHLVLHLTGNLNYYIGAQIAQTGYVRNREREFTERNPPPKQEVLQQLDEAVAMVVRTLAAQIDETWAQEYQAIGAEQTKDRFGIFLRCASHFNHHLGQMIYLAKEYSK
jgi:uncharacterized damage-inducible protein DinB